MLGDLQVLSDKVNTSIDALLSTDAKDVKKRGVNFEELALSSIKLKEWNRMAHNEVDVKRKKVEDSRKRVDAGSLQLENLLYKSMHLSREIKACQDLATPELAAIESETNSSLSMDNYTENLSDAHDDIKRRLLDELEERKKAEADFKQAELKLRALSKRLDSKKKLIEDIKLKFELCKAQTADLSITFQSLQKDEDNYDEHDDDEDEDDDDVLVVDDE